MDKLPPTTDVTSLFAARLARNRAIVAGDPNAQKMPEYGVTASFDGSAVDMRLTFRAGKEYCCYDSDCHLPLHSGKRWDWLRRELISRGLVPPDRLELRLEVIVEPGAVFFDLSQRPIQRGLHPFAASDGYRYQVTATEAQPTRG